MSPINFKDFAQTRNLMEYLKKQRENTKLRQYLEIGTTFFLIAFFLVFAIRPTILTISALVGEIKSKEVSSQQMRAKINSIIIAQDLFSQVQESYQLVNSSLPDQPRFSQASSQLSGIAQSLSIPLSSINFSLRGGGDGPHVKFYTFSLNVPISLAQSLAFIDRLQNNRRIFTLDSLSLATPKSDSSTNESVGLDNSVRISFSPKVYYWIQ